MANEQNFNIVEFEAQLLHAVSNERDTFFKAAVNKNVPVVGRY